MYKSPIELLRHIYDECVFIESVITPDLTKDELIGNEILKRAITMLTLGVTEKNPFFE